MNNLLTIFLFIFFGLLSGILGGLGMGGGTLLIPLLSIFLGLDQKLCQGIKLVSFLVMSVFSLIIHYKNGFIEKNRIYYIILSGIFFSVAGSILAGVLPSGILKIIFGYFLCLLAIIEIIKIFFLKSKKR